MYWTGSLLLLVIVAVFNPAGMLNTVYSDCTNILF